MSVDSDVIGRFLIVLGLAIAIVGVGVLVLSRVPFVGRIPGDISFERDGVWFFFPVVTCILVSILLTLIINAAIRVFR
jgi:hypothetical protein